MIKDTRYIIKRVIIGVLICLILSFIKTCEVHALTNYTQSVDVSYSVTDNNTDVAFYNDANHTYKAFANVGRGYLVGIITTYKYSSNTSFEIPILKSINARTDSGYSTCEVSSLSIVSNDNDNFKASMYGFKCDLTMGANGLYSLSANFEPNAMGSFTKELYRLTFNNNLQAQEVAYEEYIYQYLQDWIYPRLLQIQTNTNNTYNATNALYNYIRDWVYPKLGGIEQAILNQQQAIIANNNANSQAQIDAANQNTQDTIQSQEVCKDYDKENIKTYGKVINNEGGETNVGGTTFGVSDYIKITNKDKLTITKKDSNTSNYLCFYNVNKTKISCISIGTLSTGQEITIPNNTSYVRVTINSYVNEPQFRICKNGNQANNDAINDVNDTLNDSSVDDPNGSLTDMNSKIATNSVISDLLLLPVTLFQNILNSINGTCTPWNLGSLFGTELVLPCINLSNLLGSALFGVIDVLLSGIFVLSIRKRFVDIFQNITSLKDGGNELE